MNGPPYNFDDPNFDDPEPPPFPEARIRAWPKAELHVHLEGSIGPQTLLDLAAANGVAPPAADVAGIHRWLSYRSFADFLDRYFFVCRLLRREEDFARVAYDYLAAAHAQGVVHAELHISASYHLLEAGGDWAEVLAGVVAGCEATERELGIVALLIPDLSPHLGAARLAEVVEAVVSQLHPRVAALGMGLPADRWWEEDFTPLFARARAAGLHTVCHAGEHGDAEEVRWAVERFGAERIQHGIAAVNDQAVLDLLCTRGVPCDVCPASNVALHAVPYLAAHPLPQMIAAGLTVTLGSDDPPFFQTDLLNEYRIAWQACGLREGELERIAQDSILESFAPASVKGMWLAPPS